MDITAQAGSIYGECLRDPLACYMLVGEATMIPLRRPNGYSVDARVPPKEPPPADYLDEVEQDDLDALRAYVKGEVEVGEWESVDGPAW